MCKLNYSTVHHRHYQFELLPKAVWSDLGKCCLDHFSLSLSSAAMAQTKKRTGTKAAGCALGSWALAGGF
ncbi:MAG: hypothetical protein ACKPKO_53340, partial [Candidatus Fonsibacter sp.]